MTLEFEKLTPDLENMALATAKRMAAREVLIKEVNQTIRAYRVNWEAIDHALVVAQEKADQKHYRSAQPFSQNHPLDAHLSPPQPPQTATIVATDGSQIMPDRHAAHLYYLINVGGIIFYHGLAVPPDVFSEPQIIYPETDTVVDDFVFSSGQVSIERDKLEITKLADTAWDSRSAAQPLVAMLDQRLLYWPTGAADIADSKAIVVWNAAMTKMRDAGALLAGYIDRPGTSAVVTLLRSLTAVDDPGFDWKSLGKRAATQGLTDADLFRTILAPGERSAVFVYISPPNSRFAEIDTLNEVCFFYLNPGLAGQQIARVDIPRWVAQEETAVAAVHALIIYQCRILGSYPYVLARADEMAVVGHQDANELNFMIDLVMQRHGIEADITAKQASKEIMRGGRTRHEGV